MIEFYQNGKLVEDINFGITEIGKTNRIEVLIKNTYNDSVTLSDEYSVHPDVKIVEYVKVLREQEMGKVVLEFTAQKGITESLKRKQIGFKVVIG